MVCLVLSKKRCIWDLVAKKNKPIEFLPDYLLILEFYSFSYQSIEFLTSYQIVEVCSKQNNYQVYICPILIKACFQYIFYKLQLHHFLCSSPQDNCEQYQKQKPFIIDFFFVVKRPQKLSFSDISVCVPTSYFIKIFIFSMPACSVVWWVTHSTSGWIIQLKSAKADHSRFSIYISSHACTLYNVQCTTRCGWLFNVRLCEYHILSQRFLLNK